MNALRLVLITAVLGLLTAAGAHASCNTIPDRPDFAGARGSTDRPFLSPDRDQRVTVRYGSGPSAEKAANVTRGDLLVSLIIKPPGQPVYSFYIARDEKECRRMDKRPRRFSFFQCHERRSCVTAADVDLRVDSNASELSFRVPDTGWAGPVTLAITKSGTLLPMALQSDGCADVLASPENSSDTGGIVACIDTLSQSATDLSGQPVSSELLLLPPTRDYDKLCTKQLGDPKCSGDARDIELTVDTNGDAALRMNWAGILKMKNNTTDFDLRQMLASTAVEAVAGTDDRIRIPGASFLTTTTDQGGGFTPSPVFAPKEIIDRPYEQAFDGTADKGASVLRFSRRRQWQWVCDAGDRKDQACEATGPGGPDVDCPPAGNHCTKSLPPPGEYFACAGGYRDTLPCTSTSQCGTAGACKRISETGSVCYLNNGSPASPPKTCKSDTDCATDEECGPGLFEFRNRLVAGKFTIRRFASKSRGVCDGGTTEGAVCTGNSGCDSSAKCVAFRAAALESAP